MVCAAIAALGGSSAGCVSAEQHRATLGDLQRLRMEAWQRGVEAAALRLALDRATAENAQLRTPPVDAGPALAAVAARLDELGQRQQAIVDELRAAPVCTPGSASSPSPDRAAQAAGPQPSGRKVTDLLYSRF